MSQLVLLIISFLYGFGVGVGSLLLRDRKFLKVFYYILVTLLFILLFYFVNDGEIHLYNKVMLILGFCFYYFFISVKLNVKLRKLYSKK